MQVPTQGGLGQVSAPKPAAPVQAGGKFDAGAVQAENIEQESQKPTGLKDSVISDLGDQREALNKALLQMRQSLDARKNRLFDPVLMQAAAGFLKPTKTGSFGESLGYAAENAGVASEREMAREAENQKLEMELASKEMELRQQLGGDQLIRQLTNGAKPVGQQVAMASASPGAAPSAPGSAAPAGQPPVQQLLAQAAQGRIKITDEILLLANRVAPKLLPTLQEMRKSQTEEDKSIIEQRKVDIDERRLGQEKRSVIPRGLRTTREMNQAEFAEYQAELKKYLSTGDEQALLTYYDSKGYLEPEQVRGRVIPKAGEPPIAIGRPKTESELKAEASGSESTATERAKAAEKLASRLGLQAEAAFENSNIANDMIGYANNNPAVFQLMNQPGLANSISRAVTQGVNAGNFNISLPADVILQYKLGGNDLTALQLFMQKSAQLQSRGRQLNRTPGEGSTSDYETRLLGGIYALPSDSQRAIILKSDALKMQGLFDEERFKLWNQKSKQSGYTYNDFLVDDDYKKIKTDYRKLLDRVRDENMDLLSPKNKTSPAASAPATPAPAAPAASAPASAEPPKNETYSEKLKRLQKLRGG